MPLSACAQPKSAKNTSRGGRSSLVVLLLLSTLSVCKRFCHPSSNARITQGSGHRSGLNTSWKEAKLETGVQVMVPLFIANGDIIRVDTAEKKYLGKDTSAG